VRTRFAPAGLALLLAGCSGETAPHPGGAPAVPARSAAVGSPLRFQDRAAELGVRFQAGLQGISPLPITGLMGGGVAWVDGDGDGWDDLILTGPAGVAVYRNEMGRRFVESTKAFGLESPPRDVQGLAAADYDGDGRTDLLLTLLDGIRLYRGGPQGFTEVTQSAGLGRIRRWTTSAAFADVDGNGTLDLYVGRYVRFGPEAPRFQRRGEILLTLGPAAYEADQGVLLLNDGQGRFRDSTVAAGLAESQGKTLGVLFWDYDQDGDQDLYLANDEVPCDFYQNDGAGRFRNISLANGTALAANGHPQAGMGVDAGDYNGDGRPDLVVTTFWSEPTSLYEQADGGLFQERSQPAGLLAPTRRWTGFGVLFEDLDNDGRPDLIQANGHVADQQDRVDPGVGYAQPPQVFHNTGGAFVETSAEAGPALVQRIVGRGAAAADLDRDGRMDVAIANLTGPPLLLGNQSSSGNSLRVRLRQPGPNREGLGATLRLRTPEGVQTRCLIRNRSYLSSGPAEVHFGLGSAATGDLEVLWPGGRRQQVPGLPAGKVHTILAPAG